MNLDSTQLQAIKEISEWYKGCLVVGKKSTNDLLGALTGTPAHTPVFKKRFKKHFVLTGSAGTGKSTVASELFKSLGLNNISFITPTWKAALVLRRKGVENAQSVHSLIYRSYEKDNKLCFAKKEFLEDSSIELIVVDEASMLNNEIINDIEHFGIPVLYMGDHCQLPPVFGENDLIKEPDFTLTKIYRQEEGSPILDLAYEGLENGQIHPEYSLEFEDVFFANEKVLKACQKILCATNKTRKMINKYYRKYVLGFESPLPVEGDILMGFKNSHDLGIFNGEEYIVKAVNKHYPSTNLICVDLEDFAGNPYKNVFMRDEPFFDKDIPEDVKRPVHLEYSYACSVHKSQGSQWDRVLYVDEWFPKDRNKLIYTGITRAAKKVLVVKAPPRDYNPEGIDAC